MTASHPLDILFLTNYSDYCFRAIPAVAQMADTFKVRLSIMHAFDPARTTEAKAQAEVQSFFPEADNYAACHRYTVPKPLMDAVRRHLNVWPVNLIVAPASESFGWPRLGDRSLRCRLLEEFGVPVWTIGRRIQPGLLMRPVKNVACWLDFRSSQTAQLAFAIDYAHKLNARLHLLRGLPRIDEGSLIPAAHPGKALHPEAASEEIRQLCRNAPVQPEVRVAAGDGRQALNDLLRECNADVAFLHGEKPWFTKWMGLGVGLGDVIPCPAVYVTSPVRVPTWNLETGAARRQLTPVRSRSSAPAAASWLAGVGHTMTGIPVDSR